MKGALIVGIDDYPGQAKLHGCVNDAREIANLLLTNGDDTRNFHVELKKNVLTRFELREKIIQLFDAVLHTALFYFSGHGCITDRGGFIVTPDFRHYDEGISMDEILTIANQSSIKEKIIIIDCCHAGALGNPVIIGSTGSYLGEGVTILAAARKSEPAVEVNGHGIFTSLLLAALEGEAADIAGNITVGSIYAYIDRSLGFLQQRPQFKTNVNRFVILRNIQPTLSPKVLKKITEYFETPETHFPLDPTYELTNADIAIPEHVAVFRNLQRMVYVGLVMPVGEEFMYWAAQNAKACKLTPLGMHYWKLVKDGQI